MNRVAISLVYAGAMLACIEGSAQIAPAPAVPIVVQPGAPAVTVQALPPSRWTVQQIRQAFELADSDSDGQLTRAEAQRLAIVPRSFEEMDQNKDGILQRAEYEGSLIR